MRKRHIYAVLFGVPGFFVALLIAFAVFGTVAGMSWVFVFGDDPWPAMANRLLPAVFALVFLLLWGAVLFTGYRYGQALEAEPGFDRKHIAVAALATLVPVALMLWHQFSVGNLGPRHDSLVCGDYCTQQGYAGSSLPPRTSGARTCSCLDDFGNEAVTVQLDAIR